jgi:hypothetical protein
VRLRDLANRWKPHYQNHLKNSEKLPFAKWILGLWKDGTNPPGRVLRNVDGEWCELTEEEAVKVVMGILRREQNSSRAQSSSEAPPPTSLAVSSGDVTPSPARVSAASGDAVTPRRPALRQLSPPLPIVSPGWLSTQPANLHHLSAPYPRAAVVSPWFAPAQPHPSVNLQLLPAPRPPAVDADYRAVREVMPANPMEVDEGIPDELVEAAKFAAEAFGIGPAFMSCSFGSAMWRSLGQRQHRRAAGGTTVPNLGVVPAVIPAVESPRTGNEPSSFTRRSLPSFASQVKSWVTRLVFGRRREPD